MNRSTWLSVFAALVILIVYSSGSIAVFLTDWKWFGAVGYSEVFATTVLARVGLGAMVGLLVFAVLQGNVIFALRQAPQRKIALAAEIADSPIGKWLQTASPIRMASIASAVIALLVGLGASAFWQDLLLFMHGGAFGYIDPVLGLEARFYVFQLPILLFVRSILLALVVVATLGVAVIYASRGAVDLDVVEFRGQTTIQGMRATLAARRHVGILVASWLLIIAVGQLLGRYQLLYDQHGLISGPGFTEARTTMLLLLVQAIATIAAAGIALVGFERNNLRWIVGAALLGGVGAAATAFVPNVVQRFWVLPNELELEGEYVDHHVRATRFAYQLDDIEELPLSGKHELTWQGIEANEVTIENIRLWDHKPLLDNFSQVQEIRTYYSFSSVDNDRYLIDGVLRQTMLSPRELQAAELPGRARTWVNESMTYTHGYGVALGPVNEVTPEGLPNLWIQDLPPKITHPDELRIDRPEIYYGESMTTPIFIKTRNEEFDYPTGDTSVYTSYEGKGGVEVGGLLWKTLFAMREGNSKILLTAEIEPTSRVVLYRDIRSRVERIAPFLLYDRDPYMIIAEGRLIWVLDAYTTSSRFPYSQEVGSINYMRNSVKVTIDAYDGTVTFYAMDTTDPVVSAWSSAFPDLFRPATEITPSLWAHLRYPQDFFTVQSHLFATYHMTDTQQFYNREDEWEVPVSGSATMAPYYIVMRLPGEDVEEYIIMLPFVPRNKPNMAAWMVARSDGEHYGQVRVYKFPKDTMIYGPDMITARFNQDDNISEKLSLWGQMGSQVLLGTMLVIPIEESLVYVQPLYLQAETGSIPELKRVLVGYQNQIAMEETLDEALRTLFGSSADARTARTPASSPGGVEPAAAEGETALIAQARVHYDAAIEAQRSGDWARYGTELEALGAVLAELAALEEGEAPAPDDAPMPDGSELPVEPEVP